MLLNLLKSILYGIIEGITEWLPISSTGHLILAEQLIPFKNVSANFFSMFEVVIQLGAIIAVVLLFWNKLWPFRSKAAAATAGGSLVKANTIQLWLKVIVACLPAAVLGLLLDDWLDAHLYNKVTVSVTLILYGVLFILVENYNRRRKPVVTTLGGLDYKTALIIGGFQVLAMIPGTSRSGATILGAILIGCARPIAAEFSFFLAIPTMFGASALKLVKFLANNSFSGAEVAILLVGMLVSFLVSVVAIRGLMSYVKKRDFSFFGYYRIVLGLLVILATVLA